ncbi:hypothetical protein G6F59_016003 [Rhizopus arrhizus]|nr:hypothetical protein G6F59_016003 [Rhizopus arrhizus]
MRRVGGRQVRLGADPFNAVGTRHDGGSLDRRVSAIRHRGDMAIAPDLSHPILLKTVINRTPAPPAPGRRHRGGWGTPTCGTPRTATRSTPHPPPEPPACGGSYPAHRTRTA